MTKPRLSYFPDNDVLHLAMSNEQEVDSVEISPDITAELNEKGELIGIEIIGASLYLQDLIIQPTQEKLLELLKNAA